MRFVDPLIVARYVLGVPLALGLGAAGCQRSTGYCQTDVDCAAGLVCSASTSTCQSSSDADLGPSNDLPPSLRPHLGTRVTTPAASMPGDYLGSAVAATSTYAVLGAYLARTGQGAAYVVDLTGTSAGVPVPLPPPDTPAVYDYFGVAVAANGNTIAVGAHNKDGSKGAVYVYTKNGSVLGGPVKLAAPDGAAGDYFGSALSLYADTLVVGAANKGGLLGAAYAFIRSGATWSLSARLPAPLDSPLLPYDYFGQQVATNGVYAAVSAPGRQSNRGAVYLYKYDSNLKTWMQTATGPVAVGAAAPEQFGGALAMSATALVIGTAAYTPNPLVTAQGGVYYYSLDALTSPFLLTAPSAGARDRFGAAVSLVAGAGSIAETLLIGAPGRNQAFVYRNDLTQWRQAEVLEAPAEASHASLGASVATAGSQHVVGTRGLVQDVGAAYYYTDN